MTSKTLSTLVGFTDRTIQRRTKKALEAGQHTLSFDGVVYVVEVVHSARGKSYEYHEQTSVAKRKTVSKQMSFVHLAELSSFDVWATKHSKEDKLLLVTFMRKYNYTMKIIVKSLVQNVASQKQIASVTRKFMRWQKDFVAHGASALEDKRGAKSGFIKIDEEVLIHAIEGAGARGIRENYYGVWDLYCYAYQEKHSDTFSSDNEKIISYSALTSGIKTMLKKYSHLNDFWKGGIDALLQSYPVGLKNITYPNQEWQVDATKFDFMCHYIDSDGNPRIGRLNLTSVIDVYSDCVITTLSEKITSYDQVRVLHRAFGRMGMPERVYTDNGKDYVSHHYCDVLLDLGITQIKAQAGQGRQKGKIERFFGKLQTELAKFPGYIGNSVAKRKVIEDQTASHIGVKTGKETRTPADRLLKVEEWAIIVDNICARYSKNYETQTHSLLDMEALEDIRQKLGKKSIRPLHNHGINLNAHVYISSGLWVGGLAKGNEVEVYEDIDDINTIYVYKEDKFICKATNKELGEVAMTMEEHREAKKADRKNNVAPRQKSIKQSNELYERYEDHNVEVELKNVPDYAKPKPKEEKKEEPSVNNDYLSMVLALEA